jgi:hypothetical protein
VTARLLVAVGTTISGLVLVSPAPAATPASYPSCGTYWNRNTPVTAGQQRVDACIVRAARAGRRARAVAVLTTIEGDPIVGYVFVRGRRDILVVVDSTRDRYGARTWTRVRCARLVVRGGFLSWTGCAELGRGKPAWLRPVKLPR